MWGVHTGKRYGAWFVKLEPVCCCNVREIPVGAKCQRILCLHPLLVTEALEINAEKSWHRLPGSLTELCRGNWFIFVLSSFGVDYVVFLPYRSLNAKILHILHLAMNNIKYYWNTNSITAYEFSTLLSIYSTVMSELWTHFFDWSYCKHADGQKTNLACKAQ